MHFSNRSQSLRSTIAASCKHTNNWLTTTVLAKASLLCQKAARKSPRQTVLRHAMDNTSSTTEVLPMFVTNEVDTQCFRTIHPHVSSSLLPCSRFSMPCSRWYFFMAGIVGQKCIFAQLGPQKVTHRTGPSSSSYGLYPRCAIARLASGHGHPQASHTGIARKRSQQGDTKLQTEDMMQ